MTMNLSHIFGAILNRLEKCYRKFSSLFNDKVDKQECFKP